MNNQLVTIPVPGTSNPIIAVLKDGTEWAAVRHICDALGIDWKSQHRKLESKNWARVVIMTTHDSSGRKQEISMVDRRTLTMWLATIDTNRVSEAARLRLPSFSGHPICADLVSVGEDVHCGSTAQEVNAGVPA